MILFFSKYGIRIFLFHYADIYFDFKVFCLFAKVGNPLRISKAML